MGTVKSGIGTGKPGTWERENHKFHRDGKTRKFLVKEKRQISEEQ